MDKTYEIVFIDESGYKFRTYASDKSAEAAIAAARAASGKKDGWNIYSVFLLNPGKLVCAG